MSTVLPFKKAAVGNPASDKMLRLIAAVQLKPECYFWGYHDIDERPYFEVSMMPGSWSPEDGQELGIKYMLGTVPRSKLDDVMEMIRVGGPETETEGILALRVIEEGKEIEWTDSKFWVFKSGERMVLANGEREMFHQNIKGEQSAAIAAIIERDLFSPEYIYPEVVDNKVKGLIIE